MNIQQKVLEEQLNNMNLITTRNNEMKNQINSLDK